MEKTIVTR